MLARCFRLWGSGALKIKLETRQKWRSEVREEKLSSADVAPASLSPHLSVCPSRVCPLERTLANMPYKYDPKVSLWDQPSSSSCPAFPLSRVCVTAWAHPPLVVQNMIFRPLGNTGLRVSLFSYGGWLTTVRPLPLPRRVQTERLVC